MLDISFSELMIIGIVALVVIGPERLPKVARTAGHLFGRLQRYVSDVKADISREMQLDELKQLRGDLQESARSFERSMTSEMRAVEEGAEQVAQSVQSLAKSGDASPSVGESMTPVTPTSEAPPATETAPASVKNHEKG